MALVERTQLSSRTDEYKEVEDLFGMSDTTTDHYLCIKSIEKVHNSTLAQKFKEKQQEYEDTYGEVNIVEVWHGTKLYNIKPILKNNFDTSLSGKNIGHRFGMGVSFSKLASYASHYCDKGATGTMLLTKVLVSNVVEVEEDKRRSRDQLWRPPYLPGRYPLRYDTTAKDKEKMDVIVKSDKHSFLPTHVVTFRRSARGSDQSD